jgi:hypothetical protein
MRTRRVQCYNSAHDIHDRDLRTSEAAHYRAVSRSGKFCQHLWPSAFPVRREDELLALRLRCLSAEGKGRRARAAPGPHSRAAARTSEPANRLTEFQFLGNLFVEKKGGGSGLGSGASRGRVPVIRTRRDRIMGSSILASLSEAGGSDSCHQSNGSLPPHSTDGADRVGTRPTYSLLQIKDQIILVPASSEGTSLQPFSGPLSANALAA